MSQRSEVAMESCRNRAMLRAGVTSRSHVANKGFKSQQSHVTKKSCRNGVTSHARVTSKSHVANRRVVSQRSHVANKEVMSQQCHVANKRVMSQTQRSHVAKESCRNEGNHVGNKKESCHKHKGFVSQRSHVAKESCRKGVMSQRKESCRKHTSHAAREWCCIGVMLQGSHVAREWCCKGVIRRIFGVCGNVMHVKVSHVMETSSLEGSDWLVKEVIVTKKYTHTHIYLWHDRHDSYSTLKEVMYLWHDSDLFVKPHEKLLGITWVSNPATREDMAARTWGVFWY